MSHFLQIMPILTQLLKIESDSNLIEEALRKSAEILRINPSIFEDYVETFIPKLLMLSREAKEMVECLASSHDKFQNVFLMIKNFY